MYHKAAALVFIIFIGFGRTYALDTPAETGTQSAKTKEEKSPQNELRIGIELFADGRYEEALPVFNALFMDSRAGDYRAEGSYWAAMTLLASGDPGAAEKTIDIFLGSFPGHERSQEMIYQKARAAFLAKDYERALRAFQAFITAYPSSQHEASALFWSAESLYFLGRLPDAEKLYKSMEERFPDSPRAEAAKYRLSLIKFKYREDELLTLLKWSHEESLRLIEEFQRREKAYEQALEVYQKRYGEAKRGVFETQATLEEQIDSLKMAMDDLAKRMHEKDARVSELEKLLEESRQTEISMEEKQALTQPGSMQTEKELLQIKARALDLMRFYIERLERDGGGKK